MGERFPRQSALASLGLPIRARADAGAAGDAHGVRLGECGFRGQLVLRGDAGRRSFNAAVSEVIGVAPPTAPGTAVEQRRHRILWLGPDEWLVVVPDGRAGRIMAALEEGLAGEHFAVADVSHGRGVLSLAGPRARETLMKGTPLDLHPRRFAAGACAQSRLGRCHMLLHQLDDEPGYEVYVHRSFIHYAWAFLADAAREYTLKIEAE